MATLGPLPLHVPCPTPADADRWRRLEGALPGLTLKLHAGRSLGRELFDELVEREDGRCLLVGPTVSLGDSFGARARSLVDWLDAQDPSWGQASCRGAVPAGEVAPDHALGPESFPAGGGRPRRVLLLEPEVLLLAPDRLREAAAAIPWTGADAGALAWTGPAWVHAGVALYAAAELSALIPRTGCPRGMEVAATGEALRSWCRVTGVGGELRTPWGPRSLPGDGALGGRELLGTLPPAQDDPGEFHLHVVTRTQLGRPALLRRLARSLSAAGTPGVTLHWQLVSDAEPARLEAEAAELGELAAPVPLATQSVEVPPGSYSRGTLLGAGLAAVPEGAWAWVVDDDDALEPDAPAALADGLRRAPDATMLLLDTLEFREEWVGEELRQSSLLGQRPGREFLGLLGPHNRVPVCGAVLRRDAYVHTLASLRWTSDFAEDHYLLLVLMLDPETVPVAVGAAGCRVSLRGGEGTVQQEERLWWDHSRAGFLGALVGERPGGAVLWEVMGRPEELLGGAPEIPAWARLLGQGSTQARAELGHVGGLIGSLGRYMLAAFGGLVLARLGGPVAAWRLLTSPARPRYPELVSLGAATLLAPAAGVLSGRGRDLATWKARLAASERTGR